MTEIIGYISANWVIWMFAGIWFLLGVGYRQISKRLKTEHVKQEAIGEGVQALLRDRIIQAHNYYMDKGYCPIYARENIKRMYAPYHALGGNDVATDLVDEVIELPTEKKERNSIWNLER